MSTTAPPVSSHRPVLVATKLHVPELRADLVRRPELVARLVAARPKLILICAPAGWGKSILLSEWCASPHEKRGFAWVSLDRGDSDPVRFWSYVVEAIRTIRPTIGESAVSALPTAGPDLIDVVVAPLMNELAAFAEPLVLVLDDYHLVHSEAVHDSVAFLLRHLPHTVQVAIASRADPPLPLASLRAAGEVTEVRAADLRFSDGEAEALLNDSLGLELDRREVELLVERTEGWAAGLRLAGLSVHAQDDRRAFVEAFAGDDRQIGDYLHEVLDDQPARLRSFLLQTSILERMCAPLCDAVTRDGDASARLEEAERSNLFLVALDARGEWYRYHHLFRDLLRYDVGSHEPALVIELHRRAYRWHELNGNVDEAIAHAMAATDFDVAARLIARDWPAMFTVGQFQTVADWIDALPSETARADTRLSVARAWSALFLGRLDEASIWRRGWDVDSSPMRRKGGDPSEGIGYSDFARVAFDAAHAYRVGDAGQANEAGRRVLALYPDEMDVRRASANINLGESLYYSGQLSAAAECLDEAVRHLTSAKPSLLVSEALLHAYGYLAAAQFDLGELESAERSTAEGERLIGELPRYETPWGALVHVARGKLLDLRGDFAAADTAFTRARGLARRAGFPLEHAHALLLLARLKRRMRRYDEARSLAREARELLRPCPDPGVLTELLTRTERALQLVPVSPSETDLPADVELSDRELTILRLLASELSQREIGRELYISLNTVKGHVRSIFRKLGVATRAEAVARARKLSLI